MPAEPTWGYRIKNLLLAFAALAVMIVLPGVASGVVLGCIESLALRVGGYGAVVEAYAFIMKNQNLFSAVVYMLFGAPVIAWALVMGRRARRAARLDAASSQGAPVALGGVPSAPSQSMALGMQSGMTPVASQAPADAAQGAPAPAPLQAMLQQPLPQQLEHVSFRVRGVARSVWLDVTLLGFGLQFLTSFIMFVIMYLLPAAMDEYRSLVEGSGLVDYGFMWFYATVVLPPLVEEIGFRGLGLTYLRRAGVPFAVANVLQAVAFGIFHMNITQGIYTGILGLFMGYAAHRSGSIVPVMLLHAVYNFMGTLGSDALYTVAPWLPFWLEVAIGAILTIVATLSLRDRGGRTRAPA